MSVYLVVHEFAHAFFGKILGLSPLYVDLNRGEVKFPDGICIANPAQWIVEILAGPIASLFFAAGMLYGAIHMQQSLVVFSATLRLGFWLSILSTAVDFLPSSSGAGGHSDITLAREALRLLRARI